MGDILNTYYRFDNVPRLFRKRMQKAFMKKRNLVVDIFNERIGSINDEWNSTGKPTMLVEGSNFIEDFNPEYCAFIRDRIQPVIDEFNKHLFWCRYRLDEYCDITGYLPFIKNSKLTLFLEVRGSSTSFMEIRVSK